jgi:hypothetical protein
MRRTQTAMRRIFCPAFASLPLHAKSWLLAPRHAKFVAAVWQPCKAGAPCYNGGTRGLAVRGGGRPEQSTKDAHMDLTQLSQMVTWLDEEHRRDRAEIARLQQRIEAQSGHHRTGAPHPGIGGAAGQHPGQFVRFNQVDQANPQHQKRTHLAGRARLRRRASPASASWSGRAWRPRDAQPRDQRGAPRTAAHCRLEEAIQTRAPRTTA